LLTSVIPNAATGAQFRPPAVSNLTKPILMKRYIRFIFVLPLLLLATATFAQFERFVGNWEIRKSPTTGKVNLTVTITDAGDTIGGTVVFLNPDGTTFQMPIAKPEVKGDALDFRTLDHDAIMHWSLTLTNPRSGILRADRGEMLIQEKVKRKNKR
jgi:hypothetical protein